MTRIRMSDGRWAKEDALLCHDCGVDVAPHDQWGDPILGTREYYGVRDSVWDAAKGPRDPYPRGQLCIGCLEQRLGRKLRNIDFTYLSEVSELDTPRLIDRKTNLDWTF